MVDIKISCLTEVQPWGTAIADGLKSIETRTWTTHYRGLLGVHVGRKCDGLSCDLPALQGIALKARNEQGCLIAVAELVKVHTKNREELLAKIGAIIEDAQLSLGLESGDEPM